MDIKLYLLMALMSVIMASSHFMPRGTVSRLFSRPSNWLSKTGAR